MTKFIYSKLNCLVYTWGFANLHQKEVKKLHFMLEHNLRYSNGNRAFADLGYGEEDSISPSTLISPTTRG